MSRVLLWMGDNDALRARTMRVFIREPGLFRIFWECTAAHCAEGAARFQPCGSAGNY
jgi:hypothetical protein